MNRAERFTKKIGLYTIGNFGSKVLTFLMVPYYTYCISASDYGYFDLLYTTVSLLTPLITMETTEAIIAGCIDKGKDNHQVVKATLAIIAVMSLLFTGVFLAADQILHIRLGGFFLVSLLATAACGTFQQYARGLSYSGVYALSGIVYTLLYLSLNIVTLSLLGMGISGLFVSNVIASLVTILLVFARVPEVRDAIRTRLDSSYVRWVVRFSLPLIPNAMSWWLINASDRYVINVFLGNEANGIYAISCKFAAVIGTMATLVYLSWQELSLEEFGSDDMGEFYSRSFNRYARILLCASLVATSATRMLVGIAIEPSYGDAWKYALLLYTSTCYSGLSSFLNTCYLASGDTHEILKGTLIAGIVNISCNLALVQFLGIHAATLSTFVSALVLLCRRIKDNGRYYRFDVDMPWLVGLSLANIAVSVAMLLIDGIVLDIVLVASSLIIAAIANRDSLEGMLRMTLGALGVRLVRNGEGASDDGKTKG